MVVSTASAQEGGSSGLQLPTIDVTGDQGGYQAAQQSINRLQTALLNIPQTVNVVPQQEIQERRLSTMETRCAPSARELAVSTRTRCNGGRGAGAQQSVHVGCAAETGISAAVQSLQRGHDLWRACRQCHARHRQQRHPHSHRRLLDVIHLGSRRGELVVEDNYGSHTVKLPAGDMIVYPATSLHYVTPITRGSRIASFFWTRSMIRGESKRSLLFDMDMAIIKLSRDHPDHVSGVELTSVYHNLLRQWAKL